MAKRKYSKKRTSTKKTYKKRRTSMVKYRKPLPLNGFPDKYVCRLKYAELITLDATALGSAAPTYHSFRANSLFDPNYTSVGHQPRGFDELASLYDHYTVIGSKCTVHFENDVDHLQPAGQYCFLMLDDAHTVPLDIVDLCEESNRYKIAYKERNTTGSRNIVMSKKFSPYKMFGLPKKDSLITNNKLTPSVVANPTEDAFFTLGVICSRTTTTDPPRIVCRVEIEYLAVFTEKKPMARS